MIPYQESRFTIPKNEELTHHSFMTEPVDGDVPGLPELEDVVGVPPAVVELAVGEAEELPAGVEERVEHQVEAGQPDHVVRYLWGDSVEKLRPVRLREASDFTREGTVRRTGPNFGTGYRPVIIFISVQC